MNSNKLSGLRLPSYLMGFVLSPPKNLMFGILLSGNKSRFKPFSSQSNLPTAIVVFCRTSDRATIIGPTVTHGPHHGAHTSTRKSLSELINSSKFEAVIL
eukprot:TRINITY_DN4464_c0_g1_i5.p1 TRINITY_DN4464_c0_g1~~TRINITY_DN4464_c0_g1_i5.p1  ORF type:complete len:100 (+),score=7.21 TRINITY_DN4464_c0_g1_i5:743-1042(+)